MNVYELAQAMTTSRRRLAKVSRWFVVLRAPSPTTTAETQKLRTIRSD